MTEYDYNPVTWISLASLAGLSLVSLGQPGLKSGLDEQVYTGGLTAVQQILGGEIGGDTTRFVGGSDKHKTGRFLVKTLSSELVGQFLLISPRHIPVAPPLIDYYEHLVTFFAEETLKTDLVEKAEKMYDRRKEPSKYFNKREEDWYFDPVEKIIQEFEKKIGMSIDEIDTGSFEGKRLRGELLWRLKDLGGLKYSEIYEFDIFNSESFNFFPEVTCKSTIYFHCDKILRPISKKKGKCSKTGSDFQDSVLFIDIRIL